MVSREVRNNMLHSLYANLDEKDELAKQVKWKEPCWTRIETVFENFHMNRKGLDILDDKVESLGVDVG